MENRHPPRPSQRFFYRGLEHLSDLSYGSLFTIWITLALLFALAYFALSFFPGHGPQELLNMPLARRLFNSIYFSIVTATTTGYGDIVPIGFSKILASLQSIMAFLIFGIFVTKLVSVRQNAALHEIHHITFEDLFYNLREWLFIIRKDFDRLIAIAEEEKKFTDQEWDDLIVAFRQGQTLCEDIPEFYDNLEGLYTIDKRREQLLQEAVLRTLKRMYQLIHTLRENNIDVHKEEEVHQELREFLEAVSTATLHWQKSSPYDNAQPFDEIHGICDSLKKQLLSSPYG